MTPHVGDLVASVLSAFPAQWAEPWDNVGLLVGDPQAEITGVVVALDATAAIVDRAIDLGANVVATHHPASLDQHRSFVADGPTSVLFYAARHGVALVAAHTNLDRAPHGAAAFVASLGLPPGEPLEESTLEAVEITVYVPDSHADEVRRVLEHAGAGRVGRYHSASFTCAGTGRFVAGEDTDPATGHKTGQSIVEEVRIDAVADPGVVAEAIASLRQVHPYEEPLVLTRSVRIPRGAARLGRVSDLTDSVGLGALAVQIADRLGSTPRVWGDADAKVDRVACATGSAGSLIPDAITCGADVLVAGEVRYHDALDAVASGLCIIEVGHDASEWPLVPVLARAIASTPSLSPEMVTVIEPEYGWWTP